jgi:hypothetical protein
MALKDYKTISKISAVGALGSVTVGGVSFNAYKCTIQDLELKNLPSPDSGARYQHAAFVKDISTGQIGFFLVVAGNPKTIASGSLAAREVWLAPWSSGNWDNEYNASYSAQNVLTAPSVGQLIAFAPITGSNPQNANNISPAGASAGCVSSTLIDSRAISHALDLASSYIKEESYLSAISSSFAPSGSGQFVLGTGNSVVLTPGVWDLSGVIKFGNNAGNVNYTELRGLWSLANGNNTNVSPGGLGANLEAGTDDVYQPVSATLAYDMVMPTARANVSSLTNVYLVPYQVSGTPANSRIVTRIYGRRIS